MTCILRAACAALGVAAMPAMAAEPGLNDLAGRIELRAIETLTISDQQFLTGDKNGKVVYIAGELRFPRGAPANARLPAVILQHGSGGVGPGPELWARYFNDMGIAAFVVDSFSGRDLVSTSTNQSLLGRLNMVLDGYRSFDVLANHARIDPNRIAIMGFSRGGQSTLYSALTRFKQMWNPRANFAAHIPLYASCSTTFIGDTDVGPAPIRQFHGLADDYVTIGPCRPYFERLRAAGRDAQLIEIPDAHHTYDNPLGSNPATVARGSESTRDCTMKEEAGGVIINVATGTPFSYKDACITREPHVGYNEAGLIATRAAVSALLKTVFKLQ
jgi:dienelactone hydrolase